MRQWHLNRWPAARLRGRFVLVLLATLLAMAGKSEASLVAVGSNTLLGSPDGITWNSPVGPNEGAMYGTVYAQSQWVSVGPSGLIKTSPDAVSWTQRTSGTTKLL
mgnify:CR=1 FL=1